MLISLLCSHFDDTFVRSAPAIISLGSIRSDVIIGVVRDAVVIVVAIVEPIIPIPFDGVVDDEVGDDVAFNCELISDDFEFLR